MSVHYVRPNGWIAVKYSGPDNAKVEIGLAGDMGPANATWITAFFDYDGEQRIVCIPWPDWKKRTSPVGRVFLRVNGEVQR